MWVEALRNAQEIHDKVGQAVTGAEFRDGYEALDMTEARLEELGIGGMLAPFTLSCAEHAGAGRFAMMQWDGEKFVQVTDWEEPLDPTFIRSLVEDSAAKFASENGITPRECS
jgi:branched-chain amino acid transport system substrate-binding protein